MYTHTHIYIYIYTHNFKKYRTSPLYFAWTVILSWSWKSWNFTALRSLERTRMCRTGKSIKTWSLTWRPSATWCLDKKTSPNDSKRLHSSSSERIGMKRHNHYIQEHVVSCVFLGRVGMTLLCWCFLCWCPQDARDYASTIRCHARASHWSDCKGSQGDLGWTVEECWRNVPSGYD